MGILDALFPSQEEIQSRTNNALAKDGRPDAIQAVADEQAAADAAKQQQIQNAQSLSIPELGINPIAPQVAPSPASTAATDQASAQPFVPATSSARAPGSALPPAYQNLLGGFDKEMKDTSALGQAQAGVYNAQAQGYDNIANKQNEYADTLKQQQADLKAKLAPVEKVSEDINNQILNNKIDPNRYYANRSTGDKILTGIGLALSAFGGPQAVQGTVKIINDAVQRDVDNQKLQYEQLKDKKANVDNVYARLRQQGLDDQQATAGAYAVHIDMAKNQAMSMAAKAQSPVAVKSAQILGDQLEQKKNMLGVQIAQLASQPRPGDALPAGYQPVGQDQMERFVPGYGLATTKDAANKLRDVAAEINPVLSSLGTVKKIYSENPEAVKTFGTEANARAQSAISQLTTNTALMNGMKRYNPDLYDFLKQSGSDITAWKPNQMAKFNQLSQGLVSTIKGKVSPYLSNTDPSLGASLGGLVK